MKTLAEYRSGRDDTTDYFLKAFDHELTVFGDLAGDVMIYLPDLARRV